MNLKTMNDSMLIEKTEKLVKHEREILTSVLHHLREIDRRRLFSSLGYQSLFAFAVKHLNYSEDQAYRRIAAMKLLKEIPEIEEKINQGEINLTHIGLAQSLFKQEKKNQKKDLSREQKISVFEKIAKTSVREAEKITLSFSSAPESLKPDRIHCVSEDLIEMRFTASVQVQEKVDRLKAWLAHTNPHLSLGELFEKLCDLGLSEWNPSKTAAPRKRRVTIRQSQAKLRREVFEQARNQCEKCGSEYALEVDHMQPRAFGGSSERENLRLLCRSCNQRAAIEAFGMKRMDRYLNG